MNFFDSAILGFLNLFAQKAWAVDSIIVYVSGSNIFKGAALGAIFWIVWFQFDDEATDKRSILVATLLASFLALIITRSLSVTLPYRPRPVHNPDIDFKIPKTLSPGALVFFSSFPSDHATLFFALATGIFFVSRRAGILTTIYVLVMITFPRMYVGLHYPTDIVAGALIGIGTTALVVTRPRVLELIKTKILVWLPRRPGVFYAALFFVTFQIATLFIESREFVGYIAEFTTRSISYFQRHYGWFQ